MNLLTLVYRSNMAKGGAAKKTISGIDPVSINVSFNNLCFSFVVCVSTVNN